MKHTLFCEDYKKIEAMMHYDCACECHTPLPEKTPEQVWVDRGMNQVIDNKHRVALPIFHSTPPKIEEWEKGLAEIMYGRQYTEIYSKVKSFISKLVTQTRLSTIEEAKGCVPEELADTSVIHTRDIRQLSTTEVLLEHNKGHNYCRSQMLENLNKLSAKNP